MNHHKKKKKKDRYFACCSGKQVYIFNEDGKVLEIIEDGDDVRIFLFIFSFLGKKNHWCDNSIHFLSSSSKEVNSVIFGSKSKYVYFAQGNCIKLWDRSQSKVTQEYKVFFSQSQFLSLKKIYWFIYFQKKIGEEISCFAMNIEFTYLACGTKNGNFCVFNTLTNSIQKLASSCEQVNFFIHFYLQS